MNDHLLLEFDLDDDYRMHVYDRERRVIAVIQAPVSVARWQGWISIVHRALGCHAETYIPADMFSHVMLLHPREVEPNDTAVGSMSEGTEDYMCPNCVTPWKCNGPHIPDDALLGEE